MGNKTNIWNINHNSIKLCVICKKGFKVKWSALKRRKCCSMKCRIQLQKILSSGSNNPNWKGGKVFNKEGYKMIRIGNKYIYEHIWVWKSNNGEIPKGYVIHHINSKRNDNRIENLMCLSSSEHAKLHHPKGKKIKHNRGFLE